MVANSPLTLPAVPDHRSRWFWIFLLLTGSLTSTILLKIAEVQYLELAFALQILVLLGLFIKRGLIVRLLRPSATLAALYLTFAATVVVLALIALRGDFFIPANIGLLKHPVWITVSRTAELAIDVGAMLYLAQQLRLHPDALLFTMKIYFWTGVASAVYSFVSYPLNVLSGLNLGTYNVDHRMRGFFNEGGPYGLYILSAFLVGLVLYNLDPARRGFLRSALAILAVAFLGSHSKAAIFAAAILLLVDMLLIRGAASKLAVVAVLAATAVGVSMSVDISSQLRTYQRASALYERTSNISFNDGNFVYGRIAGAFIVPRMIAAHPLRGVGWGNYGLVRNDPEYRGASVWATSYDEPGLGLAGTAAELGIPSTLFLLLCLIFPFLYLRRLKAPLYVQNLALLQPIVHICGGQLNLTYPWVVTAFALALGYVHRRPPIPASPPLQMGS